MPYLVTKMLVSECHAIESDTDGQSIGQLVDAAVADMLAAVSGPNMVPQSVEFGFDGPDDFHRYAQMNAESLSRTVRRKGKPRSEFE